LLSNKQTITIPMRVHNRTKLTSYTSSWHLYAEHEWRIILFRALNDVYMLSWACNKSDTLHRTKPHHIGTSRHNTYAYSLPEPLL